jgi:tRNA pseudouridine13 synthase
MEAADVTPEMLRRARLDGSRRPARLLLDGLSVARHPDGLLFAFALPKGAYATTVLREFMKAEGAWQGEREAG